MKRCGVRILSFALLFLCSFALPQAAAGQALTADEQILHLLNRLAFGPRPGDLEKVRAMGIPAYIEQQLHPERLSDSPLEAKLGGFKTLSMTPQQLNLVFAPPQLAKRIRENPRLKVALERTLEEMGLAQEMEEQESRPGTSRMRMRGPRVIQYELSMAKLMRAVDSERQLQEVMVDFWMNHFNVFMPKGQDRFLTTEFENHALRPHALGKFRDLLLATSKSPAMLFYLDNWLSSAPEEVVRRKVEESRGARGANRNLRARPGSGYGMTPRGGASRPVAAQTSALGRAKGLNENYARELLELHTLGVEGGYTQEDIIQVAKCFTGWTISSPFQGSVFLFEPRMHEDGEKRVLGRSIRAAGIKEGEEVIEMLARHPSTARFIASKLVRRFVADTPPPSLVAKAGKTFEKTGGDIREVLRTIFSAPEFFSLEAYQVKMKKPLELVASALRAASAEVRPNPQLLRLLAEMGEAPYMCAPPTGYPDTASAWINTNALLKRLNFAMALAANRVPGVRANLDSAYSLLRQTGFPEPDAQQLEQVRSLLEEARQEERQRPRQQAPVEKILALAYMLGSPEFQKR